MQSFLPELAALPNFISFVSLAKGAPHHFAVICSYTDPVDLSTTSNQGLILRFEYPNGDSARAVFRLSGTGSAGATIRMYLEKYEKDASKHGVSAPVALRGLADRALGLVQMEELTGRDTPTVIT